MMRHFHGFILVLGMLAGGLAQAAEKIKAPSLEGAWVMHLFLGKRLFDDQVTVKKQADGTLGGTLVVPERFTAPIKNVTVSGTTFAFEITADEGQGPFSVRYEGTFHASGDTFIGFATVLGENALLGGFVGQRQ